MNYIKSILIILFSCLFFLPSYGQLKVVADGKVGVGTTAPSQKLDVVGNLQTRGSYHLLGKDAGGSEAAVMVGWERASAGSAAIRFYQEFTGGYGGWGTTFGIDPFGAGGLFHQGGGFLGIVTNNTSSIYFGVNNAEKMRISGTNGFVGINHSSPGFQLEVGGDAAKPGGGVWATASDKQLKKEVKPFKDGLQQVLAINPVTFKYNGQGGLKADGKEYVGVIAQEMQQVAPYTVGNFTHKILQTETKKGSFLPTETVTGEETYLSYDGTAVTYMLVNAIKEQQAQIEANNRKIKELEERLVRIERMLTFDDNTPLNNNTDNVTDITLEGSDLAVLKQNTPNPFNQNTTIEYRLPRKFSTAYIQIMNNQGMVLRRVELPPTEGYGILNVKAKELPAGEYAYSLIIDGKLFETKRMILLND